MNQLGDPQVGLVGESINYEGWSWRRADYYFNKVTHSRVPDAEGTVLLMDAKREVLDQRQIPHGKEVGHLQSLVLATRRDVLERIDGFIIRNSYAYAVGAEFAVSKAVEALGLRVKQVGVRPFRFIIHPQWWWMAAGFRPMILRWTEPYLPYWFGAYFHRHPIWHQEAIRQFKQRIKNRLRPAPGP